MKCPHCNKVVSSEWTVCPFCGYHPQKCINPSCDSFWLPGNAMYCPKCGERTHLGLSEDYTFVDNFKLRKVLDRLKQNAKKVDNGEDFRKGNYPGYGMYIFKSGGLYFGRQCKDGRRDGYGIYCVTPYDSTLEILNCSNTRFYVGGWEKGEKKGKGTCYDKGGKLIYYGDFENDKPTDVYPTKSQGYSSYRFELIEYMNENYYLGETKNRKRDGMGIFLWKDGGCWYGEWKDGMRNGNGINISSNGICTEGVWEGDFKK